MGIIFLLFWGTSVLLTRTCGRNETSRGAPPILSSVQHHRPNLWLLCYLFATYSLLYSLFDAVFSAIPKSSTFQCNVGAWIFRRAISSIQQENPILGEHCTATREVSWRLILTGEKTEQKNAWDIHRWPIDSPWLNPIDTAPTNPIHQLRPSIVAGVQDQNPNTWCFGRHHHWKWHNQKGKGQTYPDITKSCSHA